MQRLLTAARWIGDAMAALLLFLMMTVTFLDVSGRYLIDRPLAGSSEMERYMLALVIFLSLPSVTVLQNHISISIVDSILPARLNHMRERIVNVFAGVAMLVVGYYMWRYAGVLVINRDVIGASLLPLAPAAFAVSALSLVTGLTFLAMAWRKEP